MNFRKARLTDVPKIEELISFWAKKKRMLPRPRNYIYENLRDFWVCCEGRKISGVCGLHLIGWQGLAEVKSLAVAQARQGKGIGAELVRYCIEEARGMKVKTVITLTFESDFFRKMGFKVIAKDKLPHKIWSDCLNCVFFPDNCREIALAFNISGAKNRR